MVVWGILAIFAVIMRSLFYLLVFVVVAGCSFSGPCYRSLDEAELLMQSDPAAAMARLNEIDVSEFQDSAAMARWALLYSEAMVINRLAAPTDTIVDIAVDYYSRHDLKDEFQRASRLKALIRSAGEEDALATSLYLQKEKEFMLYKERSRRERDLLIGFCVLLVVLGVILWMRRRMKEQLLRNMTLMAEASGLRVEIASGRSDVCRLEDKLRGLLESRFALIDSLCQTYYESQGTKSERKAVVEKVKEEIDSLRSDSLPAMEQAVNDCRDNMLVRVRDVFPSISDDDYRLLVYLAGGLSTRTLSLLLDESVDVVYKRKSRLKARLKAQVEPVLPEVMEVF